MTQTQTIVFGTVLTFPLLRFELFQKSTTLKVQPLVRPLTMTISVAEELVILDHLELFRSNGFHLTVDSSAPAGCRLKVDAVPYSKGVMFGVEDIQELASIIADSRDKSTLMVKNEDIFSRGLSLGNVSESVGSGGTGVGGGVIEETSIDVLQGRVRSIPKLVTVFASRACRSAVMIGTTLSAPQMNRIVGRMANVEQPWNCPHGRPTMRHLFDMRAMA